MIHGFLISVLDICFYYIFSSFIIHILHFLIFSCIFPHVSLHVHVFVFKGLDPTILKKRTKALRRMSIIYFCIVLYEWNDGV
jgi:hypothetical protein